jgi:hypothetical protein
VKLNAIQRQNKQVRNCFAIILGVVLISAGCAKAGPADGNTIYDSNPNHLWNRLNAALFQRTAPDGKHYGLDQLDILYWGRTTNLLSGASHQAALAVLDEFINTHGEKLIQNPLKKALLQRDLWTLFDWVAVPTPFYQAKFPDGRRELESRLATAIRRLELTTNEIAALPDNYALAVKNHLSDLPAGLFSTNSVWINVSADNVRQIVPMHTRSFGGRSVFTVWFRDPDGRKAGVDYLKRLTAVKPLMVPAANPNSPNDMRLNPNFPQFPTNSQWALARRMCVIDTDGRIRPTHVVESIQLRTYLGFGKPKVVTVTNQNDFVVPVGIPPQRFNEFQMTRDAHANLISLAQDHRDFVFVHFMGMGIDAFENYPKNETFNIKRVQNRVLGTCIECHTATGIYSVNSFTRFASFPPPGEATHVIESAPEHENEVTVDWKREQFNWGLLQGLWMQQN